MILSWFPPGLWLPAPVDCSGWDTAEVTVGGSGGDPELGVRLTSLWECLSENVNLCILWKLSSSVSERASEARLCLLAGEALAWLNVRREVSPLKLDVSNRTASVMTSLIHLDNRPEMTSVVI